METYEGPLSIEETSTNIILKCAENNCSGEMIFTGTILTCARGQYIHRCNTCKQEYLLLGDYYPKGNLLSDRLTRQFRIKGRLWNGLTEHLI